MCLIWELSHCMVRNSVYQYILFAVKHHVCFYLQIFYLAYIFYSNYSGVDFQNVPSSKSPWSEMDDGLQIDESCYTPNTKYLWWSIPLLFFLSLQIYFFSGPTMRLLDNQLTDVKRCGSWCSAVRDVSDPYGVHEHHTHALQCGP